MKIAGISSQHSGLSLSGMKLYVHDHKVNIVLKDTETAYLFVLTEFSTRKGSV